MSEQAYETGLQAWGQGKGFLDNSYSEGSTEFRRYVDGLVDAIKTREQPQKLADAHTTATS